MSEPAPHRARLAQARQRLAELEAAERAYLATQPFQLVHEHDMRAGQYVVRVKRRQPPPAELLALVESTVRELRGALDELAGVLAGRPTRYPVFESLALFAQRARKAIAPMSDEAQALIEERQPYHAIGGFQNGPLWVLQQLAAADRPRLAAGTIRPGAEFGVNTSRKIELTGDLAVPTQPFDDGDVIAAVRSRVVGPDPKLDMFLRAEFALAFERRGPALGREVVALLRELVAHVEREIVAPLEATMASR